MSSEDLQRNTNFSAVEKIPLERHSIYTKVDKLLEGLPAGKVLELGCGSGRYLNKLEEAGWSVLGVDIQPQERSFVLERPVDDSLDIGRFDLVIACELIEHIPDTQRFVAILHKHVKKDGYVIISTPNLVFWVNRIVMLFGRKPLFAYRDFHLHMFIQSDLVEKFGTHFDVIKVVGSHVFFGQHRNRTLGKMFAWLGNFFPNQSAHLIFLLRPKFNDLDI